MQRTWALLAQRLQVVRRAVALVGRKPILREDRVPCGDHSVALDFGDDGSRGDRGRKGVSVDDGRLRAFEVYAHGVDQQVVGRKRELSDSHFHGAFRGPINVDLIDGGDVHRRDRPSQRVLANPRRQLFARFAVQQLGIAQPANAIARVEDYGRRDHGSEQRSPSDFIHARHELRARVPRQLFVLQRALEPLQQAQLQRGRGDRLVAMVARRTRSQFFRGRPQGDLVIENTKTLGQVVSKRA